MKHNIKITFILILMFLITQLIGLAVIYAYTPNVKQVEVDGNIVNVTTNPLPYNLEPPEEINKKTSLTSIIIAFVIAIFIILILMKFKAAIFIKAWFFIIVTLVLGITFNAFLIQIIPNSFLIGNYNYSISALLALVIALPLAIYKIFKRNILVHNFTELLIYPGIAAVFVPLLSVWTIIILLILISLYDAWAVWHSGFMQKMAKFQINELKIFGGFFIPYLNKKQREKIREAKKEMKKGKKIDEKKIRINLAILGGGDVVFPIITAGIILRSLGIFHALVVVLGATIALLLLFIYSQKGKFYPAMPFITGGLFAGMIVAYLI
ncbi:MAG: presenilin family intramembrane aspartyl protease [Candidatus Pacearchaeota archaeon]